jgi:hypothetical protein
VAVCGGGAVWAAAGKELTKPAKSSAIESGNSGMRIERC